MPKDGSATKALLAETLVSMLQEPGAEITVKELSKRAGVNRQTFYYHFETLDELVAYACQTKVKQAYDDAFAKQDTDTGFDSLAEFVFAHLTPARYLLKSKGRTWIRKLLYEESVQICRKKIDRYLEGSSPISNADREASAAYCTVASASIIENWVNGELSKSPHEIASMLDAGIRTQAYGLVHQATCPSTTKIRTW